MNHITQEDRDREPFRWCVFCDADCEVEEPEHAATCPSVTEVYPVRYEGPSARPCEHCGKRPDPSLRCSECDCLLGLGDHYTHRQIGEAPSLMGGGDWLRCPRSTDVAPDLWKGRICIRALSIMAALVAAAPAWGNTTETAFALDVPVDATTSVGPDPYSFWAAKGCAHGHPSKVAYQRVRALVRHTRPSVSKGRVRHYTTCLATRAKAHRAHVLARGHWRWRHQYAQLWVIRFNRLPYWDKQWALNTGACESGNNPATNTGNGFYGAHQWMLSTWSTAVRMFGGGWPASPLQASYSHQAVVAVRWRNYAGDEQWPVCGD